MRGRGFTLLECAILLMLMAAAALVAIPLWSADLILENEVEAARVLKDLNRAQEEFHQVFEGRTYALLQELTGSAAPRGLQTPSPLLPLGTTHLGVLVRRGYCFAVHLPGKGGDQAHRPQDVDEAAASKFWMAYAWPSQHGVTGRRLFGIGRDGVLWALDNAVDPYSGPEDRPPAILLARKLEGSPFPEPATWVRSLSWSVVPE